MFNLKYLFKATFSDGTVIKQTSKDVSKIDPKRSAFYDVLNCDKTLEKFELTGFLDKWSVNLKTGEFTHNNKKFVLEENYKGKRKLEFFRQHQHDFNGVGETDHRIIYFLGYSVKKEKYLIGIK